MKSFQIATKLYRLMFAREVFKKLNLRLFRFSLSGLGVQNYENDRVSGEHHFIKKILPGYILSNKPIFFDVGANVGNYSVELIKSFPGAFVHAFEPHPKNFSRLKSLIFSKNIKCHNIALGAVSATTTLYDRVDYNGSSHASLHEGVISDIHKIGVVGVEVIVDTLDNFCKKEGIERVDFLKVDTEGHELAVLHGARELLRDGKVGCIQFEFNEMNVVSRVFFRDFIKLLCGYKLFRLLPNGLLSLGSSPLETELFGYQNIVALPE